MKIVDLHCDTIMRLYHGEHLDGATDGHVSIEKLRQGESLCQCFAIFVPWGPEAVRQGYPADPKEYFRLACAAYQRELERCRDSIRPAYSASGILENERKGYLSAMLTVEDCVTLDGRVEAVDEYYAQGIRMAALTWNHENSLGWPNRPDPAEHDRGLKPFGIEAVRRMNELGILVDVSHLSEGGFWDVARECAAAGRPFAASHSCARALCDVPRNLTDAQLRAIGDAGGVVGVNYYARFLRPDARTDDAPTAIADVLRHLRHIVNTAGIASAALGSDYDGMGSPLEWGDAGGQQALVRALEREYTPSEVEQICRGNALRVLQ